MSQPTEARAAASVHSVAEDGLEDDDVWCAVGERTDELEEWQNVPESVKAHDDAHKPLDYYDDFVDVQPDPASCEWLLVDHTPPIGRDWHKLERRASRSNEKKEQQPQEKLVAGGVDVPASSPIDIPKPRPQESACPHEQDIKQAADVLYAMASSPVDIAKPHPRVVESPPPHEAEANKEKHKQAASTSLRRIDEYRAAAIAAAAAAAAAVPATRTRTREPFEVSDAQRASAGEWWQARVPEHQHFSQVAVLQPVEQRRSSSSSRRLPVRAAQPSSRRPPGNAPAAAGAHHRSRDIYRWS
ncbi:Uu.00g071450.m01.CDS01 [Anthostomella pinea]|uniref:Uu.00g071450.m01.CDS01 n=1 Tax=Anthostomella pinea TaxID=933095 RepID=A0AAI8VVS0_9PEZI|nr:Uu.00g071450.m01.CDS01 [Anthostomella pinea]